MIVPALLLTVSIIGTVIATSQPVWGDLVLLAGPCAIASAILLLRESRVWLAGQSRRSARGAVVIDGSNVMYWWGGTPLITPVQDVVRTLKDLGFKTGVVFDANAGQGTIATSSTCLTANGSRQYELCVDLRKSHTLILHLQRRPRE